MHLLTQDRLEAVSLALVSSGAVAGGGGTNKNINRYRDPPSPLYGGGCRPKQIKQILFPPLTRLL